MVFAQGAAVVSEFVCGSTRFHVVPMTICEAFVADAADPRQGYVGAFDVDGQKFAIMREADEPASADEEGDPIQLLTERERQVAELVSRGLLNKQVAYELRISEYTVSTHLRRIFSKLRVRTRSAMVYRCASARRSGRIGTGMRQPSSDIG